MNPSNPTVLVAGNDGSLDDLVEGLRRDGYIVLEASNWDATLRVIVVHSREIQVMLTYGRIYATNLANVLKPFRLDGMRVLQITGWPEVECAFAEIRELVRPPKQHGRTAPGEVD
jgi:hypothetical protein